MAWKVNVSNFNLLIISTFVIKQILFFACNNLAVFYSTSFNIDILWMWNWKYFSFDISYNFVVGESWLIADLAQQLADHCSFFFFFFFM